MAAGTTSRSQGSGRVCVSPGVLTETARPCPTFPAPLTEQHAHHALLSDNDGYNLLNEPPCEKEAAAKAEVL